MAGSRFYHVDPSDPRAPSREIWAQLSSAERAATLAALPSDMPSSAPPEGDPHRIPKQRALESLGDYFRRMKRRVYLSAELPVYYPSERVFAPDVLAVLDVEPHPRERWVVDAEGRGLDFVLEIAVRGDTRKDLSKNVERYARLGIPEYFAYEPLVPRLSGFRLDTTGAYCPILPQLGRWESQVLGLGLCMEAGRIRFYHGWAPLPEADELIERMGKMVDDVVEREQRLLLDLEQERERADQEHARAERLRERLKALGVDPDEL